MNSTDPTRSKRAAASGHASHHWWMQRVTAIALVPLAIWFTFSVVSHINDSHGAVLRWVTTPYVAVLLTLFLAVMFYHAHLGLQVVIEDYVHTEGRKLVLLILLRGVLLLAGLGAVFAVLRVAL